LLEARYIHDDSFSAHEKAEEDACATSETFSGTLESELPDNPVEGGESQEKGRAGSSTFRMSQSTLVNNFDR
jgi:hypothetical protein